MTYTKDMGAAARRHYEDAVYLEDAKRYNNAGYHYGIATECAIKEKLLRVGVLQDDTAIWKHLPELKGLAKLAVKGRSAASLLKLLNGSLMEGWAIPMRYANDGAVPHERLARWRDDANKTIGLTYE